MSQPELKADKIHSPIQLMAAWFVMLILLSGVLLGAAAQIEKPEWAAGYLVLSTTVLILIVLGCVILMLTKFRPNLQEGKHYAEWLKDQKTYSKGEIPISVKDDSQIRLKKRISELKLSAEDSVQESLLEKIEDSVLYKVLISNKKGSDKMLSDMHELGLEAEIYNASTTGVRMKVHKREAIWLGSNIPVEIAIPVIKSAIKVWPQLKYISLSSDGVGPDDTHWQIYLGGSSQTALEEKLQPWSIEELSNLKIKDLRDFHAEIRTKYPNK